ncbi:MAG: 4Fe-4S dicluster domain-containing protein [Desulfovibrionales bacterium]
MSKSFFIDTTKCTACRGCQVACKQWNQNPAVDTHQQGTHQNPPDFDFHTFKLVRFSEVPAPEGLQYLFFPDQCRHCIEPPCKFASDAEVEGAIIVEPDTGAVLFTEKTAQVEDFDSVRFACPYDIPRLDPATGLMSKCTMCIDRVKNGLLPACVQVCPTNAMNFGDREDMIKMAEERLAEVKKTFPDASLVDTDEVRVLTLITHEPERYHEFLSAGLRPVRKTTRQELFADLRKGLRRALT